MGQPSGYSVVGYGAMINCEPRTSAYAEALRQAITPGCTVIDVGAGFGIFALLACQYGAGSVIAIESDDSIELLHEAALANNCRDRITIIQGSSTDYAGPVKADVIVSDLRGALPLYECHIPAIIDARQRLLAPGGQLIPGSDRLRTALVEQPLAYLPHVEPWIRNKFGLDLSNGRRFAVNSWSKVHLTHADLLSSAQDLIVLDYATITSPDIAAESVFTPERAGTAHGFLIWFNAELAPGIGFSNAPGEAELVYSQAFFPFEHCIELSPTDRIEVTLKANLVKQSYIWTWTTKVWRSSSTQPEVTFRQSTFLGEILSPEKLARRSPRYAPPARQAHAIDRHCLSLFDGQKTLETIAVQMAAKFPDTFKSSVEAMSHATELAEKYRRTDIVVERHRSAMPETRDELQ